MQSFYIGQSGRRLYCNLHAPRTRLVRDAGILFCPPLGHEYYRSYRAHVRLAEHLSDNGFTVLRYDYFGTGDSQGARGHSRLDDWIEDAIQAARILVEGEALGSVVLVGMRFGAALAALAAPRIEKATAIVLWDPITDGETYINQLEQVHEKVLGDLERFPRVRSSRDSAASEYVGHDYGVSFLNELKNVDREEIRSNMSSLTRAAMISADSDTLLADITSEPLPHGGYGWCEPGRVSETIVDPLANRKIIEVLDEVFA